MPSAELFDLNHPQGIYEMFQQALRCGHVTMERNYPDSTTFTACLGGEKACWLVPPSGSRQDARLVSRSLTLGDEARALRRALKS